MTMSGTTTNSNTNIPRTKGKIPKWARIVIPKQSPSSSSAAAASNKKLAPSGGGVGGGGTTKPTDDSTSSNNRRRSSRLSAPPKTDSVQQLTKQDASGTDSNIGSGSTLISYEELIWRQWCYRIHVKQRIDNAMQASLQQVFKPWIAPIEDFLTISPDDYDQDDSSDDDGSITDKNDDNTSSLLPPPSKKPKLSGGEEGVAEQQEDSDTATDANQEEARMDKKKLLEFFKEKYALTPSTSYSPHLLPILIMQTTADVVSPGSFAVRQPPTTQTSVADRYCLINYFTYHWKHKLHPETAVITLSLDMLSSYTSNATTSANSSSSSSRQTSAAATTTSINVPSYTSSIPCKVSLHDIVYEIVKQCIQQETEIELKMYLEKKLKRISKNTKQKSRNYQDVLLSWTKYTKTLSSILVTFVDFGNSNIQSYRKLRNDLITLFTTWRSIYCIPISMLLFNDSSSSSLRDPIPTMDGLGNDYHSNPHDFLSTISSSCQGIDGIKIRHINISCNDWLGTSFCC